MHLSDVPTSVLCMKLLLSGHCSDVPAMPGHQEMHQPEHRAAVKMDVPAAWYVLMILCSVNASRHPSAKQAWFPVVMS